VTQQILVVTGKGGVGKTTIAAALALRATRAGLTAVIVETGGAAIVPTWFDRSTKGYELVHLGAGLATLSVTPEKAIEDFVVSRIKVRRLYKLAFQNRVMAPLLEGVPGLGDLVQLGKVYALAEERHGGIAGGGGRPVWDRVIVDAPATGHGLTMLASPRLMMQVTESGPFHENAKLVHDVIMDRQRTGIVLATLPEEMPVSETLDLWERLGATRDQVLCCVLNQMVPEPFGPEVPWLTARAVLERVADPGVQEATTFTDEWVLRSEIQRRLQGVLVEGLPVPLVAVPWSYEPRLTKPVLEAMGAPLDPWVLP
jgi:anion-transporting  ArsA/GET3 family ATPase